MGKLAFSIISVNLSFAHLAGAEWDEKPLAGDEPDLIKIRAS